MKKKKSRQKRPLKTVLFRLILKSSLFIGLIIASFIGSIYLGLWGKLPTKQDLKNLTNAEASVFLDRNKVTLTKIYQFNRESIDLEQLPQYVIDALIATEDVRFFEHSGVDSRSVLRVLFKTILAGDDSSGGGSTITLQLAKNIYGRENFGWFSLPVNKIKEAFTAFKLEDIYSKEEILELYLNTVPFSGNTYGIESASKRFFSKPASALSLAEAATLIGTLKANHSYNPRLYPKRSQLRRDVVIKQMLSYNYLSQDEANKVLQQNLSIDYNRETSTGSAFLNERLFSEADKIITRLNAENKTELDLKTSGLTIETTIDANVQKAFETELVKHLKKIQQLFEAEYQNQKPWQQKSVWLPVLKSTKVYKNLIKKGFSETEIIKELSKNKSIEIYNGKEYQLKTASVVDSLQEQLKFLNAASLTVDPKSGDILSYVGGADYRISQFDVVHYAKRQVGSTFKPFIYATGLQSGLEPCSYLSGNTVTYTDYDNWQPQNASKTDDDKHMNYSLNYALSNSMNTISVKVLEQSGLKQTINLAHEFGITSSIPEKPSIALGAVNLSFEELARAYSGIVSSKIPMQLQLIKRILKDGKLIYEAKSTEFKTSPLAQQNRHKLLAMLGEVVNSGTAKSIRTTYGIKDAIAGKTGTTQDNKDGWFIGLTPHLVSINWVGHNQQRIGFKSTGLGQGAVSALPIFANAYKALKLKTNSYSAYQFPEVNQNIKNQLNCDPKKRDGFLKRIFKKKTEQKDFDEKSKEEENEKKSFWNIFKSKKSKD
ncbi:transglycosylase domain-containing protein [Psychroflexus sp. ALD_RP9]|uniref:transglycosylase domain-containing protein n=1 Tax=Psychroflexus sp. ALD_RP9 TaxID=2777186 RepID=UPI001A905BAC|nr:transglycosylase domain-containing protein [Psychroflexus sp. ALD_RP9]QSS96929.1 transglycosylase domain-containing protein [Psychroflexus sp. ALD_RP9]